MAERSQSNIYNACCIGTAELGIFSVCDAIPETVAQRPSAAASVSVNRFFSSFWPTKSWGLFWVFTPCSAGKIDAEQLPQFQFGSKQVLESVLIQFLKKGLDRFRHGRAQCATGCDPAVALRILAFDHREVRFDFADDLPHYDLAWRLSQAQPSISAPNGFKVSCLSELVRHFHQVVFWYSKTIRDLFDRHKAIGLESNQHQ
jgi:hypothetical protein